MSTVRQTQGATGLRRFKPYPAYKDSGVEWLGKIPAHWEVKRLKYVAPTRNGKLAEKPNEVPYLGLEHVESWTGRVRVDAQPEVVESILTSFSAGDVLFGKLRPYLAKVARPGFEGACSSEFVVMSPSGQCSPEYLFYFLISPTLIWWIDSLTYGTKMPRVSPEHLGGTPIPLPPMNEQHAITTFLDRETAKIDALVAKKERLIELLQEKRTALITRAVTKGLDPNVPMKDSGVEWLGEIPAHWGVRRLKFLTSHITSGSRGWAEFYSDEGPVFLRIGNLRRGAIDLDLSEIQNVCPPPGTEGERTRVRAGDVLISITAFIGTIGVVPDGLDEGYVNQHVALARPVLQQAKPRWIAYCLLSQVGQIQFQTLLYGGTKEGLGLDDVRNLTVLLPSVAEQQSITTYLDRETEKIDVLVAKIRQAIERLKEYRTALISAAVTGKIDVRSESSPGSNDWSTITE